MKTFTLDPNHKINHFSLHILKVSADTFEPGAHLSSDEQDTIFQRLNEDKSRVNFKRAGDRFLIDSV